jgi:hypothetical protein
MDNMSQSKEQFEETLARGMAFEQGHAIDILHMLYPQHYIMNNQIDPSVTTGDKVVGPRLYRGKDREEEIIAPDFVLYGQDGSTMWVDAKLKGAAYPYKGRRYFSIDRYKHRKYCEFPQFMLDNFYLLFKHEKTKEVYMAKFRENPDTIFFNNKYGCGDTPVYFLDTIQKLYGVHDK